MTDESFLASLDRCEHVGSVMSNFDHQIDQDLEVGQCGDYPAWNFHGTVWRDSDGYHCKIMRYGCMAAIIHGESLQDIMEQASDIWGYD